MTRATKIAIIRPDGAIIGQYVLGPGEHVIGRDENSEIYINDEFISRSHARLIITEQRIEIEDLESTSGTFINGVTVRGRIPVSQNQKVFVSDLYLEIKQEISIDLDSGVCLNNNRFSLIKQLGRGGMGEVWLAHDETHSENVALKLLSIDMAKDASALEDLQREVIKTAALQHRNILHLKELIQTEDGPPFLVMEYIEGTDLNQMRQQFPYGILPWPNIQHCLIQLCDALEHAHDNKIAHRDIKPSNLLINEKGELKLADFGIAATISNTAHTMTMSVLEAGTPFYMSPQQIEGRQPQAADDIYSLGATFYELLTGKPPFYQGHIIHQVLNIPPTTIRERLNEFNLQAIIPSHAETIIMACLEKHPGNRPPSVRAIRDWITSWGKIDYAVIKPVLWEQNQRTQKTTSRPISPANNSVGKTIFNRLKPYLPFFIISGTMGPLLAITLAYTHQFPPAVSVICTSLMLLITYLLADTFRISPSTSKEPLTPQPQKKQPPPKSIDSKLITAPSSESSIHPNPFAKHKTFGEVIWKHQLACGPPSPPAITRDGIMIVGSADNNVSAFNAQDGSLLWSVSPGGTINSHPAIGTDDVVYFCVSKESNKICALNTKTGSKFWECFLPSKMSASPAIGKNGLLYASTDNGDLHAFDSNTGEKLWTKQTGGPIKSSPSIGPDGTVYIGSYDNYLYALNGQSGETIWAFLTRGAVMSAASIGSNETVYIGSTDHRLYALRSGTGSLLWEYYAGNEVNSPPTIGPDGSLYICTAENTLSTADSLLVAINSQTGERVWESSIVGSVKTPPTIGDENTLYIGGKRLHSIDPKRGAILSDHPLTKPVSPVIDNNGTLYTITRNGIACAIQCNQSKDTTSPWPMMGQNPQRTNCI